MQYSENFPMDVKPFYVGLYELVINEITYAKIYWDGKKWRTQKGHAMQSRNLQLARELSAKRKIRKQKEFSDKISDKIQSK